MNIKIQALVDKFLRSCCNRFTAHDMAKFFHSIGVSFNDRESAEYLSNCPWVFALEDGMYMTRAGAFTGEVFSIKPTAEEYEQRILIPGSRCIPFVDSEMLSSSLVFYSGGRKLKSKTGVFDSDLAIDMFIMYGEEYAPQYIAADPANETIDMVSRDFELPNKVQLTGIDLTPLIERQSLQKGDRLLCSVTDWDLGHINVVILHDGDNTFDRGFDGSARLNWYRVLEEALTESFERLGPCGSLEEQLANVFFENMDTLCMPLCGSFEEYLKRYAKNVGLEHFGVETRLWYKGKDVPAVGPWNADDLDFMDKKRYTPGNVLLPFTIPADVMEQYVVDMHFSRNVDYKKLLQKMYPHDYVFHKDEKSYILWQIKDIDDYIAKEYNWFADQKAGPVRREALELFSKVNALVYEVDCSSESIKQFPQQELVILTQLYSHLYRILQSFNDIESLERDADALLLSLDGMDWNFEDIRGPLEAAVESQRRNRFKVVR